MIFNGSGLRTGTFAAIFIAALGVRIASAVGDTGSATEAPDVARTSESVAQGQGGPGDPAHASDDPAPPKAISTHNLARAMVDGGPLMIALAFCSLLVITFVLERAISLRRSRIIPKPFVTRMLQQIGDGEMDRNQALELCEQNGSPIAQVFAGAVRKWGRPSVEVEQAAIDAGERAANQLRRYLRVFYGVANVGPLLGLMGTVLGMIETFNAIAAHDALGRAELLAGGIAKALLNTAGGLAVAIPATIFYVVFLSRIDRLIMDIDSLSQQLVNLISAEELQQRAARGNKAKRTGREAA
jgi:biopolymer transport protein ExbB